jgi:hypothetical protein
VNGNKPLNSVSQSRGALQNRALGPAPLLAYLSPHGLSPLRGCALPTLAKTKGGGTSPLQGIRTAKHTVDGGREASLEIVRPVSAGGSKLWV